MSALAGRGGRGVASAAEHEVRSQESQPPLHWDSTDETFSVTPPELAKVQ